VAVGHRHRRDFVRHGERARAGLPLRASPGIGFDDRGEVGAGIREEVLDAARGEQLQVGVRGALDDRALHH
jgi:hypothetical protein